MASDAGKRKRKRNRTEQSILIWCYHYCMLLGFIVSSLVLPTRYSGVGVSMGLKGAREERKIAAIAAGERKQKRWPVTRGYHEVGQGKDIAAKDKVDEKRRLTLGSITCKLFDLNDRNTRKGGMIGDPSARKRRQHGKKRDKRRKERGSSYSPSTKKTDPQVKQGVGALKHISIEELEGTLHQMFCWDANKEEVQEMEYYDEVDNKDAHPQEQCIYDANAEILKKTFVKTDSSTSDLEGYVLRPRTSHPKSSSEVPTHQHIVRQVMENKGLHGRKRKGRCDASDHLNVQEKVALHKKDNNRNMVPVTSIHSTVNTLLPLPYAEDSGVVAETAFSQSEDMLEHLCIENIPHNINGILDVTFNELGVTSRHLLDNLAKIGIFQPTKIQIQTIRTLMGESDLDVIIHSYTGSGKTLAFLLPILQAIDISSDAIQALVLAPGRELGSQIFGVCDLIARGSGARVQMMIGGASIKRQMDNMKKNKPHVLIGTPGRICELIIQYKRRSNHFRNVKFFVLDEVDSLMSDPYNHEVENIVDSLPGSIRRRTVFASATGSTSAVLTAASRFMKPNHMVCTAPLSVAATSGKAVNRSSSSVDSSLPLNIRHCFLCAPKMKKLEILRKLLHTEPHPEYVMVFVNDPYQVKWLTGALEREGIIAAPLFGDASKLDRARTMQRLRSGSLRMVVTTEMAARGIDIVNLSHVVNYDLPTDVEHYAHRSGRCGRAGRPGIVINLVLPDKTFVVSKFEKSLRVPITEAEIRENKLWTLKKEFWESLALT